MIETIGITWSEATGIWLVILVGGGVSHLLLVNRGTPLAIVRTLNILGAIAFSLGAYLFLENRGEDPVVETVVVVGIVVVFGVGLLMDYFSDHTAPTVSASWVLVSRECRRTVVRLEVTATDPDSRAWRDSGMASVGVTDPGGREWFHNPARRGDWSMTLQHVTDFKRCSGDCTWTIRAADVRGNSRVEAFSAPVPFPLCCDPEEAATHGCDCRWGSE